MGTNDNNERISNIKESNEHMKPAGSASQKDVAVLCKHSNMAMNCSFDRCVIHHLAQK